MERQINNPCTSPFAKLLDVASQIYWWLIKSIEVGMVQMVLETDISYPANFDIKFRWSFELADGNILSFDKMFNYKELMQLRTNDLNFIASIIHKQWKKQFSDYLNKDEK